MKEPFFFGTPGEELFGWYHPAAADTAVVVCNPFGYEAVCAHRALRHLAERTAHEGFPTLRFDYPGTFDSAGYPDDSDQVARWLGGIRAAAREVLARGQASRVVLVGLRLGALLAAQVAAAPEGLPVAGLVLFAPVVKGRAYTREMRAFRLLQEKDDGASSAPRREGSEEAAGFELRQETIAALGKLDASTLRLEVPTLVLAHSDAERAVGEAWAARGAPCEIAPATGYGDMMLDPHRGQVPAATLDHIARWIGAHAPAQARGAAAPSARAPSDGQPAAATLTPPPELTRGPAASRPVREEVARFGSDQRLFGIVTRPTEGPLRAGVLLLNAGAVPHTGPNRMHVLMARAWAAAGYAVLRMDTGGLGDSGAATGAHENDTYAKAALDDAAAGVTWLADLGRREGGAPLPVVASGLCSGAYLSFHLARTRRVAGALLVNPQTFYWKDGMSLDVAPSRTFHQTQHYKSAFTRLDTWKKLARGKINLRFFARTVRTRVSHVVEARAQRAVARWFPPKGENLRADLVDILSHTELAMIFSEGDPGLDLLDLQLGQHELHRLIKKARLHFEILEGPDHTFTPVWTQPLLHERLTRVLEERFP